MGANQSSSSKHLNGGFSSSSFNHNGKTNNAEYSNNINHSTTATNGNSNSSSSKRRNSSHTNGTKATSTGLSLGSSLKKSMGTVLLTRSSSAKHQREKNHHLNQQQQQQPLPTTMVGKQRAIDVVDGTNNNNNNNFITHKGNYVDEYYVSSNGSAGVGALDHSFTNTNTINNSSSAAGQAPIMNNYVTMQQQHQLQLEQQLRLNNNNNNNTNEFVKQQFVVQAAATVAPDANSRISNMMSKATFYANNKNKSADNFYQAIAQQQQPTTMASALEMNSSAARQRDGSFSNTISGAGANSQHQHHHHQQQQQSPSVKSNSSRSQLRQQQQQTPFHLSRATAGLVVDSPPSSGAAAAPIGNNISSITVGQQQQQLLVQQRNASLAEAAALQQTTKTHSFPYHHPYQQQHHHQHQQQQFYHDANNINGSIHSNQQQPTSRGELLANNNNIKCSSSNHNNSATSFLYSLASSEDSENHHHQQQQQHYYMRNLLDTNTDDVDFGFAGFMQQHTRADRIQCPQQQPHDNSYHLNPSAIDFNQTQSYHHQSPAVPTKPTTASSQLLLANSMSTATNQKPTTHSKKHQQQPISHYNKSYSFGSSLTLGTSSQNNKKKKNPLASIFQPLTSQQTNNNALSTSSGGSQSKQQNHHNYHIHSNTIHSRHSRSKSSKQHQATDRTTTTTSDNLRSCPGSLKRIKAAPLTAQQASYEAMRTIDMYLIRQIARSCMDFEMEQKIDLEIRLRELAAQSMMEAQTEIDVLEVEKSLLTSDQRMNCYATILEQQRKQLSNPSLSTDSGRGSKSGATTNNQHHHHLHRPRSQLISSSSSSTAATGSNQTNNNNNHHHTSDVIGAPANQLDTNAVTGLPTSTSSPSFGGSSSMSNSTQSPSKLSPVSGESANSPSSMASSRHSRGHCRRSTSSSSNTLNAKQKAKNKQREQLMQNITSLSNINCNMVIENKASLSISEIRIPLMWRDVDHFKGRGDYKRYAVFCLLKIDSQIYDTQLISDVDREVTDVTFDDLVVFNDIGPNFELQLEVYSCVYYEQFSFTSTPRKLKEKLTSSVSRAMGRRLATQTASVNYTKELQAYDKSYRFALIASATMRLSDASDSVKTYDLVLMSPSAHHRTHLSTSIGSPMSYTNTNGYSGTIHSGYSSSNYNNNNNYLSTATLSPTTNTSPSSKEADKNTLPLFGHFCCKLFVKPDVFDKNIKTGYLRVATVNIPSCTDTNSNNNSSNGAGDRSLNSSSSLSQTKLRTALLASGKMGTLSMSSSTLHWGLMRNFVLYLWSVDEQKLRAALEKGGEVPQLENPRNPRFTLNIDKYARLLRVSNSSITLETDEGCFVLGAYSPETNSDHFLNQADEISNWLRSIEQFIYDSHIWGTVLNHYPPQARQSALSAAQLAGTVSSLSSTTMPRTKY